MKKDYQSYIGKKIGKLTILGMAEPKRYGKRQNLTIRFEVECECGNKKAMGALNVIKGHTKSCGCYGDAFRHSDKGLKGKTGSESSRWRGCKDVCARFWYIIQKSASFRNIPISISLEYIADLFEKQNKKCAISGVDLSFGTSSGNDANKFSRTQTASLDRIDSSLGYVEGNVQWIHKSLNLMKRKMPQEEFLKWIKIISKHQNFN
jgi:hypothetical protein